MRPGQHGLPRSAHRSTSLHGHLERSLESLWTRYCKRLKQCQKRFSNKSVHNLRVATRRMLSQLDLVGALCPQNPYRKTRRIFKNRLDAFDRLRDTQVQLQYVVRMQPLYLELTALSQQLERREWRLIKSTAKKVRGFKTRKVAKLLASLENKLRLSFAKPGGPERNAVILMRSVQGAFDRVVKLRGLIDPSRTTTIHRTRIAFKKFRYMVESLQPLLPRMTSQRLERMHQYQTEMGEIQDVEILMARVDKAVAGKKLAELAMRPFRRHLVNQRAALLKAYGQSADQLFSFWSQADFAMPGSPRK